MHIAKTNLKTERIENYAERQIHTKLLRKYRKTKNSFFCFDFFGSAAAPMNELSLYVMLCKIAMIVFGCFY